MKRKPILIICITMLLLSCFIGCGVKTDVNNFAAYADASYHSNPIDDWYQEVKEEYVGTSWSGVIAYIYRSAWKAELEYRVQREGTEQAESYAAYLEAVEQEAAALENWWRQHFREEDSSATGANETTHYEVAQVYKNGLFQLEPYYLDYIFDPEAATEEMLSWE